MRKIDDRFILNMMNDNVDIESNDMLDCKELVLLSHNEFTDRRDILAGDRLNDLREYDSFEGDWTAGELLYRKFLDYVEYVGDNEYTYVLDELQFTDAVLLQRLTVYKNGEVSKVTFVGGDALKDSFRVDHMLAYVNDMYMGLAR